MLSRSSGGPRRRQLVPGLLIAYHLGAGVSAYSRRRRPDRPCLDGLQSQCATVFGSHPRRDRCRTPCRTYDAAGFLSGGCRSSGRLRSFPCAVRYQLSCFTSPIAGATTHSVATISSPGRAAIFTSASGQSEGKSRSKGEVVRPVDSLGDEIRPNMRSTKFTATRKRRMEKHATEIYCWGQVSVIVGSRMIIWPKKSIHERAGQWKALVADLP